MGMAPVLFSAQKNLCVTARCNILTQANARLFNINKMMHSVRECVIYYKQANEPKGII